jgi:hypothetical protein
MSEEFRKVQYVKITDPAMGRARGRAFPVINWELDDNDNILSVECLMSPEGEPRHTLRLGRHRWRPLYSSESFILKITNLYTNRLLPLLNRRR